MKQSVVLVILLLVAILAIRHGGGDGSSDMPRAAIGQITPVMQSQPATTSTAPAIASQPATHSASMPATSSPATTQASPTTLTVATRAVTLKTNPHEAASLRVLGQKGYWRLMQDSAGVWWFESPEGKLEFLNCVTTVQPFQLPRAADGPHFVSKDYDGPTDGAAPSPKELDDWAQATLNRIRETGFKGLGAWCNPVFHKLDVPMSRDLNIWSWMSGSSKRLYSPDWQRIAEKAVKLQVDPLRDNRNLIGYFIDNELDWGDNFAGVAIYFDNLPAGDPNRREVMQVIRQVWPEVQAFNEAWGTNLKTWEEMDAWKQLPRGDGVAYDRLAGPWLEHLARDYFRITTRLIRQYDPNHLILGVRFRGYAPREVCRASRDYTDAQSLNYYVADARLDLEMFRYMYELSGQPVLITEYSFHSLDGRSGNRNTVGFAAQVLDQKARADAYRLFTTRLARVPYVVAADWFQWMDEPPSGRSGDGEDVNFGVVDIDDRPYDTLVNTIATTAPLLNPMHADSYRDDQKDLWRESFSASKPTAHVPHLSRPIRLDGEMSDWSPSSRLQGLRHAETVGLERSALPMPNVYMGWTDDGLYLGFEVFDNDIQGAPATGWWWTRDNVELWLSTRPVRPDQMGYDAYAHQFFFVPQEFLMADGSSGVVGQWHRSGDAIKDHLIPHPQIKSVVRILADRYVVEMFIPTSAMHGWDPEAHPDLSFNINIRNFQHATDYFWSAPKELLTQIRPLTWGNLILDPPPVPAMPPMIAAETRPDTQPNVLSGTAPATSQAIAPISPTTVTSQSSPATTLTLPANSQPAATIPQSASATSQAMPASAKPLPSTKLAEPVASQPTPRPAADSQPANQPVSQPAVRPSTATLPATTATAPAATSPSTSKPTQDSPPASAPAPTSKPAVETE